MKYILLWDFIKNLVHYKQKSEEYEKGGLIH